MKQAQDDHIRSQIQCASFEERLNRSEEEKENYKHISNEKNDQVMTLKQEV